MDLSVLLALDSKAFEAGLKAAQGALDAFKAGADACFESVGRAQAAIDEAAEFTGIGRNTLRMLIEWKKLPVLKVGRKLLIRGDTLEAFIRLNEGRDLRDRDAVKAISVHSDG